MCRPRTSGAVALLLVKLAQLVADFPEIREIDLNPVLADETGVIAVDARVSVAPVETRRAGRRGNPRFAIRPYPTEWERHVTLAGRNGDPRPPGPAGRRAALSAVLRRRDAGRFAAAFLCAGEGIQPRLHRALYPDRLRARHGLHRHRGGDRRNARRGALARRRRIRRGEYAILVRSDLKGRGLGWLLMQMIIEYARAEGIRSIRRPSAAGEHDDAGHVPGARLSTLRRSAGAVAASS